MVCSGRWRDWPACGVENAVSGLRTPFYIGRDGEQRHAHMLGEGIHGLQTEVAAALVGGGAGEAAEAFASQAGVWPESAAAVHEGFDGGGDIAEIGG